MKIKETRTEAKKEEEKVDTHQNLHSPYFQKFLMRRLYQLKHTVRYEGY